MGCNCSKIQKYNKPTPNVVKDCLCINDVRVGCNDGPEPCGGQIVIDLTQYNDVTASDCDVVYSLLSFDTSAFSNVVLTEQGELTITSSNTFVKSEEFNIDYHVDSPCTILSNSATVYVCMEDICSEPGCDPCTSPEIQITSNSNNPEIKIQRYDG